MARAGRCLARQSEVHGRSAVMVLAEWAVPASVRAPKWGADIEQTAQCLAPRRFVYDIRSPAP